MKKLRITVLAGGPSMEREVSLESGRAVAAALRRRGHDVFLTDIGPAQLDALDQAADVIFPALHGAFGEDGAIQSILEARGIPFVGSGSAASALAMDKWRTKEAAKKLGMATPAAELWTERDLPTRKLPVFGVPAVVKPVDQGSSVDTFIIAESQEFPIVVQQVVRRHGRALVEQFIAGEELTVGIVGDEALPPICVRPKRAFYDYDAKYHDDSTEYIFEAGIPAEILQRAGDRSRLLFQELGCRHLARIDWIVDGAGELWMLEVNTIPGFTSHSLVPKAAAHIGVSFDDLVERLVMHALEDRS